MLELTHAQSVGTFFLKRGPVLPRLLALPKICSGLAEPAVSGDSRGAPPPRAAPAKQ